MTNLHSNMSSPINGVPFKVGTGFEAHSYRHSAYSGMMDPLIMVDYYTMTQSTFGPHAHAGLSAVSILFEDSEGEFNNLDSLGNDIDLLPGDLYWMKAGRGAVHDEKPKKNSKTHALQVFVNLPTKMKHDEPASLHVRASDMPDLKGLGYRVRVVLGESNGVKSAMSPAQAMTILDGFVQPDSKFEHVVQSNQSAWILAVDGSFVLNFDDQEIALEKGQSISFISSAAPVSLKVTGRSEAHFALLQGNQIKEPFVQRGPFVMSTEEEIDDVVQAYEAGKLGSITEV